MRILELFYVLGISFLMVACGGAEAPAAGAAGEAARPAPKALKVAIAKLNPTEGNRVHGTVTFEYQGDSVTIRAEVLGLTPGLHGFHIHEVGDCSDPAGKSAGGHFNPESVDHGGQGASVRHVGDLGNLKADESGTATVELTDRKVAFDGPHSILGRAVIVHAGEDDLVSQPTGAAGARVACGIIEAQ